MFPESWMRYSSKFRAVGWSQIPDVSQHGERCQKPDRSRESVWAVYANRTGVRLYSLTPQRPAPVVRPALKVKEMPLYCSLSGWATTTVARVLLVNSGSDPIYHVFTRARTTTLHS